MKGRTKNDAAELGSEGGTGIQDNGQQSHCAVIGATLARPSAERLAALRAIRDAHRGLAAPNQRARLLAALRELGNVSTFEAMRYLDIFDPRPRKLELVRQGHPIITLRRRLETEAGVSHCIGVYVMTKGGRHG